MQCKNAEAEKQLGKDTKSRLDDSHWVTKIGRLNILQQSLINADTDGAKAW